MGNFESTLRYNFRILYWHFQFEKNQKWPTVIFNDYHYRNYLEDGWFAVYAWNSKSLNNKEYK